MFHWLDAVGSVVRSALALGFAAMWGWSSVLLNAAKLGDLRVLGLAGTAIIVGLMGAAIGAGFIALLLFLRKKPDNVAPSQPKARPIIAAEPPLASDGFDPDAIIARHVQARRQLAQHEALRQRQSVSTPRFVPSQHRPLGAASRFGRKLA